MRALHPAIFNGGTCSDDRAWAADFEGVGCWVVAEAVASDDPLNRSPRG